jgi:hypothetical protein
MNPWPGKTVVVRDAGSSTLVEVETEADRTNGECVTFPTVAGHKYSIQTQ